VLLLSLLILFGGLYYELVVERNTDLASGRNREPVEQEIQEILFFYAVPSVMVTLLGGWWLMRSSLRPVSNLTSIAERLSAQNLKERVPRSGNGDELDRLTEVFNSVLQRLEASFAREREFTLHASHELKTPLTILRSQTESFLRDPALSKAQQEMLGDHLDEIQRLAAIVDDLSLLAKADAGQLRLTMERINLGTLVSDAIADTALLGESSKIQVSAENDSECWINGDRHRLRQLLLTLSDNALKYCQTGGSIRSHLAQVNGFACLEMVNTGPGIPPSQIERVFDRFFRGDPAHGTYTEGSGLGLAIAKWIVGAHGGTIQIRSVPNQATTIQVLLPLAGTPSSVPITRVSN
jgi:signal transduction histidine kinase